MALNAHVIDRRHLFCSAINFATGPKPLALVSFGEYHTEAVLRALTRLNKEIDVKFPLRREGPGGGGGEEVMFLERTAARSTARASPCRSGGFVQLH